MTSYPDLDLDVSGYTVRLSYEGGGPLRFPGTHDTFQGASNRALAIKSALFAAGETGISARISYTGQRPAGFPRHGVTVS